MERQKEDSGNTPQEDKKKTEQEEIEHTITVMLNEPMKFGLPYGAKLSDLLKKVEEEYAKKGKTINVRDYSIMMNNKTVLNDEDPVLIKASVVTLVKKITGGTTKHNPA